MHKTILAIETASTICGVAVIQDGKCVSLIEKEANRKHAEILPRFIQQSLEESNHTIADLDTVAVSIGPGSFTGLRIGLGMAKGLTYSKDLPIIPVPTIAAIALGLKEIAPPSGIVLSHGNRVFYQEFKWVDNVPTPVQKPAVGDIEDFLPKLSQHTFHWNCDALIPKNQPIQIGTPSAKNVGLIGHHFFDEWVVEKPYDLVPEYIAPFEIKKPS